MKLSNKMKDRLDIRLIDDSYSELYKFLEQNIEKVDALEKALEEVINNGYCIRHKKCEIQQHCVLNFSYDDCPMVKAKELLK